jgi:hypothetical protein
METDPCAQRGRERTPIAKRERGSLRKKDLAGSHRRTTVLPIRKLR